MLIAFAETTEHSFLIERQNTSGNIQFIFTLRFKSHHISVSCSPCSLSKSYISDEKEVLLQYCPQILGMISGIIALFAVFYLFIYFKISCETPTVVLRNPGWETLAQST
jgi:hypothetical protein